MSEKLADTFDPLIKYGGGDKEIQSLLLNVSAFVEKIEKREIKGDKSLTDAYVIGQAKNAFDKSRRYVMEIDKGISHDLFN